MTKTVLSQEQNVVLLRFKRGPADGPGEGEPLNPLTPAPSAVADQKHTPLQDAVRGHHCFQGGQ